MIGHWCLAASRSIRRPSAQADVQGPRVVQYQILRPDIRVWLLLSRP